MIVGSGIDLAEIGRIQQSMDRYGQRFLDRVYTAAEQAYCLRKRKAAESFAARFAAKEAGAKALGTGISHGVNWLEIEVVREPGGRPTLRFTDARPSLPPAWARSAPRFPSPTPPRSPWPAWCSKTDANAAAFCYSQGVNRLIFNQGECRAKPQRDSVVATESGSFGAGGLGRPDRR